MVLAEDCQLFRPLLNLVSKNTQSLLKDGPVHAFSLPLSLFLSLSLSNTRSIMYGWLNHVLNVLPKLTRVLCTSALPTTV